MSLKNIYWFIVPLFLIGCARQTSPTGGPKDTIPPILITRSSVPQQDQTNFKGKELQLTFSEMVVLNNPREQIIVTPSIGKDYEAKVKKDKVIITLENDLRDSTTYTFNFREAVQDITEKNPAKNLQLAFSTGSYLDSLSIEGIAHDVLTGKPLEEITVAVEPQNDTFSIFKHAATYFTKTDEKGNYKITHLKPGVYHVYAIDDRNKNLVADSKSEMYGFLKNTVQLEQSINKVDIGLVRLDARPLKLTSTRPYNTYFNIRLSKGVNTFNLSATDSSDLYYSYGADQANIQVYNTIGDRDSLLITLKAQDSLQNTIDTSLYVKFATREVEPEKFSYTIKSSNILADKGFMKITAQFSKPLKEVSFDSIFFRVDSLNTIRFTKDDVSYDEPHKTLTIQKSIDKIIYRTDTKDPKAPRDRQREKSSTPDATKKFTNELHFGKAAFISIEQDSSATLNQNITPLKTEALGVIFVEVKTQQQYYIVQILNKDQQVLHESKNVQKVAFQDLSPGDYQLRIILDTNNNGVWDPGNYFQGTEPEKIKYYMTEKGSTITNLKANWELGPLLITL
jgi:uncharacterized protein (DUF2141 family)